MRTQRHISFLFLVMLGVVIAGCGGGITQQESSDYDTLIKRGWREYNRLQFDLSQSLFQKAKEADTTRPEAYVGCGWALFMRQKPDSALVEFQRGFKYVTSMADTVDTVCGISGCYLARNENTRAIDFLSTYDLDSFEDEFPLQYHDFFLDRSDLELVLAQAFYRLGMYSNTENADPNNALFHLNAVSSMTYTYTTPIALMEAITDVLSQSQGGLYQ